MKVTPRHDDKQIYEIQNAWQLITFLIKRCKIEIVLILTVSALVTIAIMNFSYSKQERVSIKSNIKIEDIKK